MASAHYFYLPLTVQELEQLVGAHQEEFEEYLKDTFTEGELSEFEKQLDSIAAIVAQPIISEISFDDFYAHESQLLKQREYFESCQSSICLENLPDFHTNPFQVTYLIHLLTHFEDALIDQGGVEELLFKQDYLEILKRYKSIDSFISSPLERPTKVSTTKPIHPIDFLIQDVYIEFDNLRHSETIYAVIDKSIELPEKTIKIFNVMMKERLDSTNLLKSTGLNPKDFGDNLERLKFWLRKLQSH